MINTDHDVSIPVDELDKFFQAPEATLETAEKELGKFVLCRCQDKPENLNNPHNSLKFLRNSKLFAF